MRYVATLVAFLLCLAPGIGRSQTPAVPSVTAIDIALEPDATMIDHANALNARLRQSFPQGYALDATHHPHVTMLQRYVRTADLRSVYALVGKILATRAPARWKLQAFRIDHAVWSGLALTVIVVKPTSEVHVLQQQLIDAVAPYTVKTGSAAAFDTTPAEPDINSSTLDYVQAFVPASTGKNYVPHVTVGVASVAFVKTLEAEPFDAFTFSPVAVSIYQLGNFGTARKELKTWTFTP
jgi:hypothetical protein